MNNSIETDIPELLWWNNLELEFEEIDESEKIYYLGMQTVMDYFNKFIRKLDKNDTSLDDLYLGCTVNEIKLEVLKDFLEYFTAEAQKEYRLSLITAE